MKHQKQGRIIAFLTIFIILVFPLAANTALAFTVKSGHPRVFLDTTRVDTIRTASQATIPLNKTAFPSVGTLTFDIKPVPWTNPSQSANLGIFDQYDGSRDHIFVRHTDQTQSNGKTGCGSDPADQANLCMQVALQSPAFPTSYIAVYNFLIPANQWCTLKVSWNTASHTASLQIGTNTPVSMSWKTNPNNNNLPYDWQPSDQQFIFTGRDGLDNILLYGSDNPATGPLLVNYPMNDVSGVVVTDVSGNSHRARINNGVTWDTRSAGDTNIRMDGKTGKLSVIADSVLTEAWLDFYNNAVGIAYRLNTDGVPADVCSTSLPANVCTGHPNSIEDVARNLGLAYLVTGEARFRSAALIYANRLLAVTPRDTGGDYTQAGRIEAMGVIYDWFFSDMATTNLSTGNSYGGDLATAIEDTIKFQAQFICGGGRTLTTDWNCSGSGPANPDFIGGHSHQNNTETTAALLAIIDEHPELQNLLNIEYQNFMTGYNPARAWIGVDGGHHMGWAYGAAYTFLDSIQLWNAGTTDVSMLDTWQGKLVDRYVYGMRGDMAFPASGDAFSYAPWDEIVTGFALWGSKYYSNTTAQNFYNNWILPAKMGGRLSELLYWEPNLPESPIEQLDFSRWFRNAGQVVMRDSWDFANSALLEFKSSSFKSVNHQHLDENAFTLFYKAPLLIDSGFYDSYGSSQWQNYFTRTIAHNAVTVFNPQEQFVRTWTPDFCNSGSLGNLCSNDGGQQFPPIPYPTLTQIQPGGSNALDGVVAYEYSPEFTYTVGNASKAYSATKLDQANGFVRSIVFLRQPTFWSHPVTIMFDKVTAASGKEGLVKRFLLHTANEPEPLTGSGISTMSGNMLTIHNGSGLLFSQTLLPENPVLTKIGGGDSSNAATDYRFMAPNCINSSCSTDADYLLQNFPLGSQPASTNNDVGAWRVEITAPTPAGREYFLHVFSIADNDGSVSSPPSAQNLSSASAAVALLANTQTIVFNKGDQAAANLSWDTPVVDSKIIMTGLQPNAAYSGSISANGSGTNPYTVNLYQDPNGRFQASAQGVLNIDSSLTALDMDLAVTLSATPNPVYQGSNITYMATVTNNGPSAASNVTISGLTGCTLSSNSIPSGGTASCTVSVVANTVGTITQAVTVNATEYDPNLTNNTASVTTTVNPLTDLAVTIAGSPSPATLGQSITYTISVTNNGPSTATNVSTGGTLASCTTTDLGTLTSGQTKTCTRTVTPSTVGTLSQTVSVSGTETDPNTSNNSATLSITVQAPDLVPTAMSATKSGNKVYVSDTVKNQGTSSSSTFTVSYYLSTNATYESGTDLALVTSTGAACTRTISSLATGASSSVSNKLCYKPSSAKTGVNYYVLTVDDATNQVIESNEANNVKATTGTVRW